MLISSNSLPVQGSELFLALTFFCNGLLDLSSELFFLEMALICKGSVQDCQIRVPLALYSSLNIVNLINCVIYISLLICLKTSKVYNMYDEQLQQLGAFLIPTLIIGWEIVCVFKFLGFQLSVRHCEYSSHVCLLPVL